MYNVVGGDGQVYGPVGTDTLVEWCKEGRITARTNLMDPISGRVLRAEDLSELREILMPAPPAVGGEPPVVGMNVGGPPGPQVAQQQQMPYQQMPQQMMPQQMMPGQQMPQPPTSAHFVATQVNAYPPAPMPGQMPGYGQAQMPMPDQIQGSYPQTVYPQNQAQYPQQQQQQPVIQVNNVVASYQQGGYAPQPYVSMQPQKSKATALLLCFFFGPLGVHRFYLGHNTTGAIMAGSTVLTAGIASVATGPWAFVDFILICTGTLKDHEGRPLI